MSKKQTRVTPDGRTVYRIAAELSEEMYRELAQYRAKELYSTESDAIRELLAIALVEVAVSAN